MVSKTTPNRWPATYEDAVRVQLSLKSRVIRRDRHGEIRLVAGADVSYSKGSRRHFAGVVVMSYPSLETVEEAWAEGASEFPYIPGLLSFREGPILQKAFAGLVNRPDLIIFDGQGIAHPRGFGLASHMGVLLGIPSVGCAKSVLVGDYNEPGMERGSRSPLVYKGGVVGAAQRTRDGVKPVFVSVGHMVGLDTACRVVLEGFGGYRLPEPTRRAHLLVNRVRKEREGSLSPPPSIPPARGGKDSLMGIYGLLYARYGPQDWWPGETPFEVMVGAILTQNTNWKNVEKAIINLKAAGALGPGAIHDMPDAELAELIRPSGYYNMKARRLKAFISYFVERYGGSIARMKKAGCDRLREELLSINGIGPETADSILLYALDCPVFVVDAYTKRIFSRHGFFAEDADYHDVQRVFMEALPKDAGLFNEYHALIVRLAKDRCLKKAGDCGLCAITSEAGDG